MSLDQATYPIVVTHLTNIEIHMVSFKLSKLSNKISNENHLNRTLIKSLL